jgi:hypothetical protein
VGRKVANPTRIIADENIPIHAMAAHDATVFFGSLGTFVSLL